ncbi:hypothetical protein BC828DRAFT_395212 [Blastocladiella britannica]|nr:hypothetical protein BC828DRAFT_395212 [Blastocladiella britannica]
MANVPPRSTCDAMIITITRLAVLRITLWTCWSMLEGTSQTSVTYDKFKLQCNVVNQTGTSEFSSPTASTLFALDKALELQASASDGGTLKKTQVTLIASALNEHFDTAIFQYKNVKDRLTVVRNYYWVAMRACSKSGWGWNEQLKQSDRSIALAEHPFPYFDLAHALWHQKLATGEHTEHLVQETGTLDRDGTALDDSDSAVKAESRSTKKRAIPFQRMEAQPTSAHHEPGDGALLKALADILHDGNSSSIPADTYIEDAHKWAGGTLTRELVLVLAAKVATNPTAACLLMSLPEELRSGYAELLDKM